MTYVTKMAAEAAEPPQVLKRQLESNTHIYRKLSAEIEKHDPEFVYIIGRGTSDHAGVFGKYLIETEMGLPVASAAPSVNSVFGKSLRLNRALVFIISQSGRSPDILAQAKMAKEKGALCVALVNDESSPVKDIVDVFVPLCAGPEIAVAATKSYLATLYALLSIVAACTKRRDIHEALLALPAQLASVITTPSVLTAEHLAPLERCVVLGRAFGYAISREIALKMKEVCGIQAEAFSSAEFLHGPISLLNRNIAIIDAHIPDASSRVHKAQIEEVARRGAQIFPLFEVPSDIHPLTSALVVMQRFYLDIEKAAREMGMDPDSPVGLKKVTETL
ncbi:glucosamine-6-phosphate deaminase NagB-II [Alteromonas sp. KUL106]|uniref:glucosamine-6-phosphate deaminase NagB-II n=1 Tax=Alteromonas sp. KUL106 TaxID=2480799 RepID=UPI0012E4BFD5|nr:SIS domain-containing protein [Alteromonas sp. KUL106]GFD66952.1 glutamine--fructose-6-phosphate aminotransferase [Alteromonas sp. KUL106]